MRSLLTRLLLATLAVAVAHAQEPSAQEKLAQMVAQRAQGYVSWGPTSNSPGVTMDLVKIQRPDGAVRYRLKTSGLPRDRSYNLLTFPVTQNGASVMMSDVMIDKTGFALCRGTPGQTTEPGPDDYVDVIFDAVKGEPMRLALVSTDGVHAMAKTIPIPNAGTDKACSIQSVLLYSNSELVFIEGTGFKPGAEVDMISTSEGDTKTSRLKVDANGWVGASLLPYEKGHEKGTATVTLKSAECSPSVSFPWGKGVNNPPAK